MNNRNHWLRTKPHSGSALMAREDADMESSNGGRELGTK
jgi:hypothetical protein